MVEEMTTMDELQTELHEICERSWPGESLESVALALCEEICELDDALHALHHHEGKLCRALVKRGHGTRGTPEQWTAEVRKECADVALVLLDIASREGFSLFEAMVEKTDELRTRDVNHHPLPAELAGDFTELRASWVDFQGKVQESGWSAAGRRRAVSEDQLREEIS